MAHFRISEDMMQLIVIYHNFANVPNDAALFNTQYCGWYVCVLSVFNHI